MARMSAIATIWRPSARQLHLVDKPGLHAAGPARHAFGRQRVKPNLPAEQGKLRSSDPPFQAGHAGSVAVTRSDAICGHRSQVSATLAGRGGDGVRVRPAGRAAFPLFVGGSSTAVAVGFVPLFGLGFRVGTMARPAMPADVAGIRDYAT